MHTAWMDVQYEYYATKGPGLQEEVDFIFKRRMVLNWSMKEKKVENQ